MLIEVPYNRQWAVKYARKWALSRNPLFFDFTGTGGNCTNFVSQCVYAGCGVMNDTPTFGWYYRSPDDRAPAWTSVEAFHDFLTGVPDFAAANGGVGPYAQNAQMARAIDVGDVIQLANAEGDFYHSLLITAFSENDVLVCAQSDDALDRPLSTYSFSSLRILHILGARIEFRNERSFQDLLDGVSLNG